MSVTGAPSPAPASAASAVPSLLTPRERIVRSAGQLIRTKGVSGTGLREVVETAEAPRGSLQHYFPEGKDQLVSEALLWMGSVAARRVERVMSKLDPPTPSGLLAGTIEPWRKEFLNLGYEGGCPLVAAAADVSATSDGIRTVLQRAFQGWLEPMAAALVRTGVPQERAGTLATMIISALEGAIILSRISRDTGPLDAVEAELGPLLDAAVS